MKMLLYVKIYKDWDGIYVEETILHAKTFNFSAGTNEDLENKLD